jgi:putative ABC transport system permease protein
MIRLWSAIRFGLLDMRGDWRRFGLIIACLAVGTALIAGVSSVAASMEQTLESNAALIMGGNVELSRADRAATMEELQQIEQFGRVADVVDTNVRAEANDRDAFVDLISIGAAYPLLGEVYSPQMPPGTAPFDFLSWRDDRFGALLDQLMLDQLGLAVGDEVSIAGTPFEVRGVLGGVTDAPVRGFRLGLPAVITTQGFSILSDRTSPLPGLGTYFRYKLLLPDGADADEGKAAVERALHDPSWTVRTARDGLGPMVRYYDMFMRFLVIVGLASLLIGGVSVWTGMSAYISERAPVIAILRSMGARQARVFLHFLVQVATLAAIGVGIGLIVGGSVALVALPIVGRSVGVDLPPVLHAVPLLVAAGVGLLTAFAFAYLPLLQAQGVSPVDLFRSKGLGIPPINWRAVLASLQLVPLLLAAAAFIWLAILMTGDTVLVLTFAGVSAGALVLLRLAVWLLRATLRALPEAGNRVLRHGLREIAGPGHSTSAVVVAIGLTLTVLAVVLVLQLNLRNEYLGASVFDAPTLVASDLFDDEVAQLHQMEQDASGDVTRFTATPMLRGSLVAVNDTPVDQLQPRGPEASFLLSGEVPMTYRAQMPASSRLVQGEWWAPDYSGTPKISLHQSLRGGLGLKLGDKLTFDIFGDQVTAEVANFRDYSWQGGIDFLTTFAPGALEGYPATLLGAVTAAPGREETVTRQLATDLPDVRFIAIGETLTRITEALSQLSLAATLVGGLAVANGLLVLLGSLAMGRRRREADAVITKVLGGKSYEILTSAAIHYLVLAALAAIVASVCGTAIAWVLVQLLLQVEFAVDPTVLLAVNIGAIILTAILGATTILNGIAPRPALYLRELGAE